MKDKQNDSNLNSLFNPLFTTEPVVVRAIHVSGTVKPVHFLGVALGRAYVKWPLDTALLVRPLDGQFMRKSCQAWKVHPEDLPMIQEAVLVDKSQRAQALNSSKKGAA